MTRSTTHRFAVLALSLLAACSEQGAGQGALHGDEIWRVVHRYAPLDPVTDAPKPESASEAVATIGDESRPALRAEAPFTLNYTPEYAVPVSGKFTLRPPLPKGSLAERVLVEVRVRVTDRWQLLPGRLLEARSADGKLRVDVELDLPFEGFPQARGRTVGLWVTGRIPTQGRDVIEADALRVPARARLDFAVGVAEGARALGPVEFEISACQAGACEAIFSTRVDPSQPEQQGFVEHGVDLEAFAGRDVALRFATTAVGTRTDDAGYSMPFWADPTLLEPAPLREGALNLILLSVDTLRADHIGAYGYERATTPFIDARIAGKGTLFEHYVAAASSTRPSHMTMFTSLPPSVHGATENAGIRTLPSGAVTLAELLQRNGFATAAITENGAIDRSRGFGRGFDVYAENRDAESADMRTGHITKTFDQGIEWLERRRNQRFFLFLHTYQVHNPFTPPPEYEHFFTEAETEREDGSTEWDPLLYDREIRYTDDQIRDLFEALDAIGALERTLFVLTSDHGEAFLEHGFVAHGANVHREVLNVPLVFVGPGVPAGRRIAAPVPMLDLMPTLLDLLDVPPGGQELGRSQAAIVVGGPEPGNAGLRPIFAEAWATRAVRAHGVDSIAQPTFSLELGGRKLIRSRSGAGFRYELYDVTRDPLEEVDLYERDSAQATELREMIARYEERTAAGHRALGERRTQDEPSLDPVLEEKLRALGYID